MSSSVYHSREVHISAAYDKDLRLDRLAQIEKLRLLYQQSFSAIFASLFNAALICVVLWQVQEKSVLLSWFAALFFASLARLILFYRYWHFRPENEALLAWERPYLLTLLASSLAWGVGAVLIMPEKSVLHQIIVYFFLMGMSGGAIAMYSAHRLMALATICIILLPTTFWFLLQGTIVSLALASGALMFVAVAIGAGRVLSSAMHRSFRLGYELQDARDAAERRAYTDALTGLSNRRAFYQQGEEMLAECKEDGWQLAMIISDVDYFKNINDTWGHHCGDVVLKAVAEVQQGCLRSDDLCARLGGEEFGMLLLVNDREQAREVAEALRCCLEDAKITCGDHEIPVAASFGVAVGGKSLESLFKRADAALYRAKETGRNRVVCCIGENEQEAGRRR